MSEVLQVSKITATRSAVIGQEVMDLLGLDIGGKVLFELDEQKRIVIKRASGPTRKGRSK